MTVHMVQNMVIIFADMNNSRSMSPERRHDVQERFIDAVKRFKF